jgi:hypothetical protein
MVISSSFEVLVVPGLTIYTNYFTVSVLGCAMERKPGPVPWRWETEWKYWWEANGKP